MTTGQFSAGDVVRHQRRPEWGMGTVQRVENVRTGSRDDQRLWIRFPNIGLKSLLASVAELELLRSADGTIVVGEESMVAREMRGETGWLGAISKTKPEDAMTSLPAQASDPFLPAFKRLEFVLGLYRFDPAVSLIEWAVAQSGLNDPMGRFNRHELEQFFKLWSMERDAALQRLLIDHELRASPGAVKAALSQAHPVAQATARRFYAIRG